MNPLDPNVQSVEAVAQALGDLCDEVVLVGGCAAGLLCTSPSAAPPRVTFDVDVVAEVAALAAAAETWRDCVAHDNGGPAGWHPPYGFCGDQAVRYLYFRTNPTTTP